MAQDTGEKTHAPSEKRLREAGRNGDLLRSRELGLAASVLLGAAMLQACGPWLLSSMTAILRMSLQWDRASLEAFDPGAMLLAATKSFLPPVLVMSTVMVTGALITQLVPSGKPYFVFENLMPKSSRLNPAAGLARMFGPNGWIEIGKGLVKVSLLLTIAYVWGRSRIGPLITLQPVGLAGQLDFAWGAVISLIYQLGAGLVVIALMDFPLQWYRRMQRLRMTLQEVRDEYKEQEGSPEAKSARRGRQRQIAKNAIAGAMKKAQFVVTNPSHFAVAMTYDPALAPAPIVLAKGKGEQALAIRELAAEHGLPCLEYPGLARALFYTTRENQIIREELYMAVAGVLAFVFSLRRGENRDAPEISLPVTMRFDSEGRPENGPDESAPAP
jgi:flagellar biosynthetic protein FlhB